MQCSNCEGENDNDSQFCVHCGCKTTVNQPPPISIDSEKPVEPWGTTISVGFMGALILGMAFGYLGQEFAMGAGAIYWIFFGMHSQGNSTSRPWYRQATIIGIMVSVGPLIGILVQKILLMSK
jgi:hypothetical protein